MTRRLQPDPEWYVDAWSVIDGCAFASLRRPESLDAQATFFVGPPYFEPEPVASLATALAATRLHFQAGFWANEAEVAFPSLEHVVEAVRRAYRAGGIDIDGNPAPVVRRPREPSGGGEAHPEELVDDELRGLWLSVQEALVDDSLSARRVGALEHRLIALMQVALVSMVPKFVEMATREMVAALASPETRSVAARELGAWIEKAASIGVPIVIDTKRESILASIRGANWAFVSRLPKLGLPGEFFASLHPLVYRTSGNLIDDLRIPYLVPIPNAFQHSSTYPIAPTLGHLLAAASADRRYAHAVNDAIAFVPLLVASLMQVPRESLPHGTLPLTDQAPEVRVMCGQAARWLARALPTGLLAGHPAEQAIHDLVVRLMPEPEPFEAPIPPTTIPMLQPLEPLRPPDEEPGLAWGQGASG